MINFKFKFLLLVAILEQFFIGESLCYLYEIQQVETSLENAFCVETARSTVECTLQCQRLKKTPFYTDKEKCYCLDASEEDKEDLKINGEIFEKVRDTLHEIKEFAHS